MELELTRVDYTIVGLTSSKCLKLLPSSASKTTQKVVVGDQDGILQIFSLKKGEVQTVAKIAGPKITKVELGGTPEGIRDKIFVSCDSEVKGYTKKGKQFLGFDTNLTEPISTMCVEGTHLFISGRHGFYHYVDLKEVNSFFCSSAILDIIILTTLKGNTPIPVLACDDRIIRVLEDSHELYSIPLTSLPTVLHRLTGSEISANQILYGTKDGGVGCLRIARELTNGWVLAPEQQKGEVTSIESYDFTGDGCKELITARDDGFIEIYKLGQDGEPPKLIYTYACNETVTCLVCGVVGSNGFDEVLVSTYSGWIFGLTTESTGKRMTLSLDSSNVRLSQEAKQKILRLRNEIEELEEKIAREREKYQAAADNNENAMSTIPAIAINDKFYLQREDASYTLCIEVQTSIDNVLIQSDVPVDLLDVEKNSAVVSFSDCDPANGNFLLATYRCQLNTTRLDLKIRTIEGQYGTLQTYVTPNVQPKCCQLRSYKVKPLSLHTRVHACDPKRPYNLLSIRGGFSLAEIHSWIEFCLPEVPSKPPPGESGDLTFVSAFLGTMLRCTYSKGEGEFRSDNLSTISILKDVISKEATKTTKKKRNLDISWKINEDSVGYTLDLLRPKLEHQLNLQRKIAILESMTELDLSKCQSEEILLTDEYMDILKHENDILEEYKKQPAYLDRLCGMVTDLFIDKHKFMGVGVKGKVTALLKILEKDEYSYENLLAFFSQ